MVCIIIDIDFPATIVYQDKIGIKMERMPDLSDILKHKASSAVRSDKTIGGLNIPRNFLKPHLQGKKVSLNVIL